MTFEELEQSYRESVSRLQVLQKRLGAIVDKANPQRVPIKTEAQELEASIRNLKEQIKNENARRNFAGVGSPLHEACIARFPSQVVAELEADAVARQGERERKAADRRAARAVSSNPASVMAAAPPTSSASTHSHLATTPPKS
ncbi:MAG: hypothetical protein M3O46_16980 [Myxococcota bacterium]|nr:hypothetical protein [Myxococcota bacterium]